MAAVPMPSAEYLRQALDYDPESGTLTWRIRPREHFPTDRGMIVFNAHWLGIAFGTIHKTTTNVLYIRGRIACRAMFAHRIIYKMVTGNEPDGDIDHWDGNGLHNWWINLRDATRTQTVCNTQDRKTSVLRGAFLRGGRYIARCRLHGRSYYFGTYDTPEQAHTAYVLGAKRLHGEFAFTNRGDMSDAR